MYYFAHILSGNINDLEDYSQLLGCSKTTLNGNTVSNYLRLNPHEMEITEEQYNKAIKVMNDNKKKLRYRKLEKLDMSIIRYQEERDLVSSGRINETYLTEDEYYDMLEERIRLRTEISNLRAIEDEKVKKAQSL